MKLTHQLNLKQEQKLVMTPKLQQAIELLQFSTLELKEYIQDEMLDNPLLELEDDYGSISNNSSNYSGEEFNYENFIAEELTLDEYLRQQLSLVAANKNEEEIGEYIIGNLDESGFFNDIDTVVDKLEVDREEVVAILEKIKTFDPIGIAASDIQESLLIQLNNLNLNGVREDINLAKKIVRNYLDEIGKNQIKKISKGLKIKTIHAQQLVDLIKSLTPIPTDKFNRVVDINSYLEPDVVIKKVKDDYVIVMKEASFPTLRINKYYRRMLQQKGAREGFKGYVKEKLDSALWLIKSIEQRRRTIYNIVQELINLQQEFLDKGLKYLKPMTMKEVADRIEMHESTVSRATSDKYIQTPQGLFSMKFFFSESIQSENRMISVVSVKQELKDIISQEDKSKPLSDRKLVDELKESGMSISRRTVAKYRKELRIPSSRKRKRYD